MIEDLSSEAAEDPADDASVAARFVSLLEKQKRILYKVAYIYCRDPEERQDLIQEMVFQLWRAFRRFGGRSGVATWTYRVALNVAISWRRRDGRRIRDTTPLEIVLNVAEADRAFDADIEKSQVLRALIDGLDEFSRSLVLLYLEGLDHAEIAGILGTSASNVGTRLGRIRHKLKAQIDQKGPIDQKGKPPT
jgi:RNA polymerase sigma factor (sigma-70 family)